MHVPPRIIFLIVSGFVVLTAFVIAVVLVIDFKSLRLEQPANTSLGLITGTNTPAVGYDIIIVAGQSNAVGGGLGDFSDPTEDFGLDGNIMQIGRFGSADRKIIPIGCNSNGTTYDGLQFWRGACTRGKGAAPTFARLYASEYLAPGRKVVIVPAAYGATSILAWNQKEAFYKPGTQEQLFLWDDLSSRVQNIMSLPGKHRIVAAIWLQGETDVVRLTQKDPAMSGQIYQKNLEEIIQKFRSLSASSTSGVPYPIVSATLSPKWHPDSKDKFTIDQALLTTFIPRNRAAVAESNGLDMNTDGDVHYAAQSLVTLGYRLFDSFRVLAGPGTGNKKIIKSLDTDYGEVSQVSMSKAIADANQYFKAHPSLSVEYLIRIPEGVHDLTAPTTSTLRSAISFVDINPNNRSQLIIAGAGRESTTLILPKDLRGIFGVRSSRITMKQLHMTVPGYTVTQGTVVNKGPGFVVLDIPSGFPTPLELWREQTPYRRYLREYLPTESGPRIIEEGNKQISWSTTEPALTGDRHWKINTVPAHIIPEYNEGALIGVKSKHMENAYFFMDVHDITFNNIRWSNRTRGVFRGKSSNITVRNCVIERMSAINGQVPALASPEGGPQFGQPGEPITGVIVDNCTLRGLGDDAIGMFDASNSLIRRVRVYDSFARGIMLSNSEGGVSLSNNTTVRAPLEYIKSTSKESLLEE